MVVKIYISGMSGSKEVNNEYIHLQFINNHPIVLYLAKRIFCSV